jgi:tellurite resistance protein
MHYPWQWVSPQLLNSKGEQIFYPVVDDIDRSWARRLEWAINSHRELAEADLNALQAEFERVLRTSREAVGRRDDRLYIKSLEEQLASAHQHFRELRRL